MSAANDPVPGRRVDWSYFDDAFPPTEIYLPEDPVEKREILSAMFHASVADVHRLAVVCFYAGFACGETGGCRTPDGELNTGSVAGEVTRLFELFLQNIRSRLPDSEGGENV